MVIKRGDMFYADLSPVVGSEQGGIRPVLVIQNNTGNKYSPTVIVSAITSQQNKSKLPTHIELSSEEYGLKSIAFCSISTGVFNFPKDQASKLAIEAVRNYLMNNPNTSLERIIFNTFSDEATETYRKNLK